MRKIGFVLTTDFAVKAFLLSHLRALSQVYEVVVIVNTDDAKLLKEMAIDVLIIPIKFSRKINIVSDIACLFQLFQLFNHCQFDAVHSITPKAGLLAMLASWLLRVPLRVHTFTGQVWASKKGVKRFLLKRIDCLIATLATHNLIDSPSQLQFLLDEKVTKAAKSYVFAKGSISGVDLSRFKPNSKARDSIRKQLNIADEALIFLFIGRLNVDKGVLDLAQAFSQLGNESLHLLFVGPDEQDMQERIIKLQKNHSNNIHFVGHTDTPEVYMAAADVLCLPSYREGFGTVLIEAAAVGIPAIASRIYGITDAVVDNETGVLHEPRDIDAIKSLIESLVNNKALRVKLGKQAKERVAQDFSSALITQAWVDFYQDKLGGA
jgi:glycosyltransferase involved in cell wall biosynthesis